MPPIVITIANQKGGTGKTTLTALLAYGLASKGHNVLVLDLDPQAHLSSLFIKIDEIENVNNGTFHMALGHKFNIRKVDLKSVKGQIGLVPSGLNYIINVYRGNIPAWDPFAIYRRITREPTITKNYDYVLCDTPPELFPPTIWGLYAADYLIIPSNMEELSLAGVKLILKEVLPDVMVGRRDQPKVLGITLINVIRRYKQETFNKLNDHIVKYLRKLPSVVYKNVYEKPLFNTVIHRNSELADLVYRPRRWELPLDRIIRNNSDLRREVEAFTDEVLNRVSNFKGIA